jgi:hypothetical protein
MRELSELSELQPEEPEEQAERLWTETRTSTGLVEFYRQGQCKDHRLLWQEWRTAVREYRKVN